MRAKEIHCSYSTAYLYLRDRIIHSYYSPGTRLNISELADDLRMSPTPVREALSRLAQDKIIETRQQRGFFVKKIDATEVTELYALIHMHAAFLVRCAAIKHRLSIIADQITTVFAGPTAISAVRQFRKFHAHLDAHAGAPNATQALDTFFLRTYFVQLVEFSEPARRDRLRDFSEEIAEMARDGDHTRCYHKLDRMFLTRTQWLGPVIKSATRLTDRGGAGSFLQENTRSARKKTAPGL